MIRPQTVSLTCRFKALGIGQPLTRGDRYIKRPVTMQTITRVNEPWERQAQVLEKFSDCDQRLILRRVYLALLCLLFSAINVESEGLQRSDIVRSLPDALAAGLERRDREENV